MNEVIIVIPIINKPALTDEMIVEQLMKQLNILIEVGALKGKIDDILHDFNINKESGYINAIVDKDSVRWADKLQTVAAGMAPKLEVPAAYQVQPSVDLVQVPDNGFKMFSAATIQERLRIAKQNPKLRFRYTIMDYKRFWNQRKDRLLNDPEQLTKLKNMFLTDVMGMITEVLPSIEEGKQLASLVGTNQVTGELNKSARELSMAYRRALKSEKSSGQINKSLYQNLKKYYTDFMNTLMSNVFTGIESAGDAGSETEEDAGTRVQSQIATKEYSRTSDGRIKLFS